MHHNCRLLLILIPPLAMAGCGTTSMKSDEFAALSKYERASLVCGSTDSHRARSSQLASLSELIEQQNALLKSGMRTWTTCRMVNEAECAICTPKIVNRCTDGAVPIDSSYEAKVRDDYVSQYEAIKSSDSAETSRCSQLVLQMPISEAYGLYLSGLDPVGSVAAGVGTANTAENPTVVAPIKASQPQGYAGQMKDGSRHGVGTQSYGDGGKYYGDWRDDMRHGKGTYFYSDGRVYEGDWVADKLNGYVTQTFPSGEIYEGFMKQNQLDGYGVLTCPDGSSFDFYYENGKRVSGTYCPKSSY